MDHVLYFVVGDAGLNSGDGIFVEDMEALKAHPNVNASIDEDKKETRHPIDSLDEIYGHADAIRKAVQRYA